MRETGQSTLVWLECTWQDRCRVHPLLQQSDDSQQQDGDADGFVLCQHANFLHRRQILGHAREGDLRDDQGDNQPMKQLRNGAPADGGVTDGHVSKLKGVSNRCKIPFLGSVVLTAALAIGLVGCPTRPKPNPPHPPTSEQRRIPGQAQPQHLHEGRPYDIASGNSLLTLLVFRGGALAKAGHNHVIASHALSGTLYVPSDLERTTFEVRFPVAELTVDEASLRAQQNDPEFPPDVPDSAKEGTRKNMLGSALLDAEDYPDIELESSSLESNAGSKEWLAHVAVTVRDHTSSIAVPVHYEAHGDEIVVSGEFPLKQTDLGLTPFSALLGALQVVDEMKVRFRLVAIVAKGVTPPSNPPTAPTHSGAR